MAIDDEDRHRMNVLLEDIRANQQAMFEGMTAMESRLTREFREEFSKVHIRLEALESAVKQNSADIKQNTADIKQNSADIKQNSADIKQNSADIKQNTADIKQNSADIKQNTADIKQNTADIKQNSADIRELREELRRLRHDFNSREELERIASLEDRVTALERNSKAG